MTEMGMSEIQETENQKTEVQEAEKQKIEAQKPETEFDEEYVKRYSVAEKALLAVSLLLAILFDRLIIAEYSAYDYPSRVTYSVFWLCYIVIFYLFYRKRLKWAPISWFLASGAAALSLWGVIFSGYGSNSEFWSIAWFVIPGVLMLHAQWSAGAHNLRDVEGLAAAWCAGWIKHPFTGLGELMGAAGSLFRKTSKPTLVRVFAGAFFTVLLLVIIVPLLMGADKVFSYHLNRMITGLDFFDFFWHAFTVVFMFGFFYSFLWNIGFGQMKSHRIPADWSIDIIISAMVIGSISLLYLLFCLVQFTYLFAGAGLPEGMTYSEYAREGFAQTVTVCTINLLLFGVFLRLGVHRGRHGRLLTALLSGLLALTCIMLVSGAARLNLYIAAYGMTWLRLLSAWFIVYLAAVIGLCGVRLLYKKQMPVAAICFLLLLGWYVALGYLNPDGFIEWYNNSLGMVK